jgi:hypothetical protein
VTEAQGSATVRQLKIVVQDAAGIDLTINSLRDVDGVWRLDSM